jgi:cell division protein FtsI/penicillin-binding protein 2
MATFKVRMIFVSILIVCAFGVIVTRLFIIQILNNNFYSQQSKKQTQQRALIPAKRGRILDRKGTVLATNVESRLMVNMLSADSASQAAVRAAGKQNNDFVNIKRLYPYGECSGAVLGYVGKDGAGLGGAEFYFDRYLKGEDGWTILSRDARNNKYAKLSLPSKQPVNGSDVYLTIDLDIQKIVENALRQTIEKLKACGGMCIIMEPSTGKILAMAGEPSFNPNFASRYPLSQRLNKCINYTYEPGSTFKALTAACALEKKVIKENDTLDGNLGSYEVFNQKIRDEKPFGRISFMDAFKYSSNVCFAKVANSIGNDRFYAFIKNFGFGAQTGIQLPGEELGIVRPVEKWSGRSRVTMAIGQEVSVTLLQMSMLFAAVANGGVLVEPRIFEKVVDADGAIADSSGYKPLRRVISSDVSDRLKAMMCEVVKGGTGMKAAIKGIEVAGKTGTAQKIDKATGSYSDKRAWASFIGFLPADNPLLLCAVVIDEPANAEMGGTAAAPVFQNIMSQIISHPQLEYAEKILHQNQLQAVAEVTTGRNVPDIRGMSAEKAAVFLNTEKLPYEIVGDKNGKVASQMPEAGFALNDGEKIKVYACRDSGTEKCSGKTSVPDCVGKDLRDAVNALNMKGLTPFVRGAGLVKRQSPIAGSFVKFAEPCTLSCAFEYAFGGASAR